MKYFVILVGLFLSTTAFSQTNTWIGGTDTDWHKACNWSLNLIPTCTHDVVIPNVTNDPKITAIAHCRTIDVQSASGALLEITSSGNLSVSSTNGGACSGTATDNAGCCTTSVWDVTSNPYNSSANERAYGVALDDNYMYVCGGDYSLGFSQQSQWRIEKRNLSNGALVTAFDGDGIVQSNFANQNDIPRAIAIDASGIYIAGNDATGNTAVWNWRVEKRNLTTGALITTFGTSGVYRYDNGQHVQEYAVDIATNGTNIYTVGVENGNGNRWHVKCNNATNGAQTWFQTSDPSTGADIPYGIAVDGSGVYIAGLDYVEGNFRWRIEKRNLASPGGLIGGFGSGGVVTFNPTSGYDYLTDIAVDATGLYILGHHETVVNNGDYQWRIEKRDLSNGALITGFGTNGVLLVNPTTGYDASASLSVYNNRLYVVGTDFSNWRTETFNATTGASICVQNPAPNSPQSIAANATGAYAVGNGYASSELWRMIKVCVCP